MKLFSFLKRDKGLEEANLGLDRAYHRFMQELWTFHLWWETYLREEAASDMLVQKIKCK